MIPINKKSTYNALGSTDGTSNATKGMSVCDGYRAQSAQTSKVPLFHKYVCLWLKGDTVFNFGLHSKQRI